MTAFLKAIWFMEVQMPDRRKKPSTTQNEETTRERILHAAVQHFSRDSYEATVLRDLAAEVGVDVAYVHRCFGSKEKLFGEALLLTVQQKRLLSENADDFVSTFAREMLRRREPDELHPLDIAIRSFSSPDASRVLRAFITDMFIADIKRMRPGLSDQRAALMAAFVAGVGIVRDVIGVEPLLDQEGGNLENMVVETIESIIRDGQQAKREQRI